MLPDVNVKEWHRVARDVGDQFLVLSLAKIELSSLFVVNEPAPATAHDACCLVAEQFDEFFHAAVLPNKLCVQLTSFLWQMAVLWSTETVPEEFMVEVAATIKMDLFLKPDHGFDVSLVHRINLLL